MTRGRHSLRRRLARSVGISAALCFVVFSAIGAIAWWTIEGDETRQEAVAEGATDELAEAMLLALAIATPLALGTSILAARWLTRRATTRINRVTKLARRVHARDFTARLPYRDDGDELDDLARAVNQMLARVEAGVVCQRQFAADASHELRTPLATLRANLEIARHRSRTSGEWKAVADDALAEIDRMTKSVDALLELARAGVPVADPPIARRIANARDGRIHVANAHGMRVIGLTLIAITALGGAASADIRKGPYVQNITASSVTVMWETVPAIAGRVTVEGPGLPAGGKTVEVEPVSIARAVVDGLSPASRYRYVVEIGTTQEAGELATAPADGDTAPFAFAVYGDNGVEREVHRRITANVISDAPDFVISTGDLVGDAGRPDQWQSWFAVDHDLLRDRVLYPALGNHDVKSGETHVDVGQWFAFPGGERSQLYYAFTYGRSRFVVLDSNARGEALDDETAWLEHELGDARAGDEIDHVFVVMHHPMFSIGHHGAKLLLRQRWVSVLEKFQVTAVFSGHDHVYERARAGGVHYFVSGGGGASLYTKMEHSGSSRDAKAVERFVAAYHYLRVEVDGARISVTAVRPDGTTIETTEWTEPVRSPQGPPPSSSATVSAPGPAVPANQGPAAISEASTVEDDGHVGRIAIAGGILIILALISLAVSARTRGRTDP